MTDLLDEGVIKFNFSLKQTAPLAVDLWADLERWRLVFFEKRLIGEYPREKVGYGNLSLKIKEHFIITGTQTGSLESLDGSHYTQINKCSLSLAKVVASGPIAPSSETLTHFAIYEANKKIKVVFHIHDNVIWKYMCKNNYDYTSESISYGTEEMAAEAQRCIGSKNKGIFVMKGHQDGVIAYGEDCESTGELILDIFKKSRDQ